MRLKKKTHSNVLIEKYQESLLIARFYYHSSTRSSTILVQMRIYFCSKIMYKVRVTMLHSRHFVSVTRFCCFYRQRLPDSRSFDTQMTKMQINASGQVLDAEMQQWIEFVPTPSRIVQISIELASLCQTEWTENARYMWLFPRREATMTLYVYSYKAGFDAMDSLALLFRSGAERIYFSLGLRAKEKHLLIAPDTQDVSISDTEGILRGERERRSSGQAKKEKRNSNMPGRYLCHEIPRRHSVAVFVYSWQCREKQIPRVFSRIWNNFSMFLFYISFTPVFRLFVIVPISLLWQMSHCRTNRFRPKMTMYKSIKKSGQREVQK